ncbi:MAG: Asp-tRNA(Asn)/Glu-tRNA(Gln) amidotransferase subunit GatB [Elusimicrobia bacterium]|nr:Asp-tRNA(Asn)/Glu-tRNA(Gln) amidotransferase subunit GatB [Elusimicrobiota bacterium]
MKEYELVVGLEVHAQLATRTKLFCACGTDGFGQAPNSRICPVCTAQPGSLPVLNRRAVELGFQAALALDCEIKGSSIFARKNYFYPDLPKAYQISQYDRPFSENGRLTVALKDRAPRVIRIKRIHLEEDAGKLLHELGAAELDGSLVDFNRAGVPLIEIVTEPDLRSSEEAYAYLSALKEVVQFVGASRCDMEKGELRCDANVSVRPIGQEALGTRAEIKNLNSFKNVKDAVDHEFRRQVELVESGGTVVQETRLWDAEARVTRSLRSKEDAHDYRYFPDPDLPPLAADPNWVAELKAALPELPAARRARFSRTLGLSAYDAGVLTADRARADFFETAARSAPAGSSKVVANLFSTEILARLNAEGKSAEQIPFPPGHLGSLAGLVAAGSLSSKGAKDVLIRMWETGREPKDIVGDLGLAQVRDDEKVRAWVKEAVAANPKAAADLKGGKAAAIGALVGAVMKLSRGQADPGLVNALIREAVQE